MFDALDKVVLPQVPQRHEGQVVDPIVPLMGMATGMALGFASRNVFRPRVMLGLGLATWAGGYGLGKLSLGEPHDYFGRENAPASVAVGAIAVISAIGSSWAFHGAWDWFKGR